MSRFSKEIERYSQARTGDCGVGVLPRRRNVFARIFTSSHDRECRRPIKWKITRYFLAAEFCSRSTYC